LRQVIFPHVELRGSGNIFNQLTVELDKIVLSSFKYINLNEANKSINLNVESIFTEEFENFMKNNSSDTLGRTTFEFKQSDILQHYDEFIIALKIIQKINSKIAVDAVLPETLGLVNFGRIKPKLVKIFWRAGSDEYISNNKDVIEEMVGHNIDVVLARIDDQNAMDLAKNAGIKNFQGFLIDKLINGKE
jgi:EAL domain-containing protein (putative c-di-GMP-specific phosphodiesterase class I)